MYPSACAKNGQYQRFLQVDVNRLRENSGFAKHDKDISPYDDKLMVVILKTSLVWRWRLTVTDIPVLLYGSEKAA